jgi:hypothetical protein
MTGSIERSMTSESASNHAQVSSAGRCMWENQRGVKVPEKREAASQATEVTSVPGDTKLSRLQRLKAHLALFAAAVAAPVATELRWVLDHPWAFMNGQMVGGFYATSRFIDSDAWAKKDL